MEKNNYELEQEMGKSAAKGDKEAFLRLVSPEAVMVC